jgi:mRNA interferase RelE/StbE
LTPSGTSGNERTTATYRVELAPSARRSLDRLHGADLARLRTAIEGLADQPRPRGCRKLARKRDFYRLRVGDHRVIYAVRDQDRWVIVTKVARRTTTTYR